MDNKDPNSLKIEISGGVAIFCIAAVIVGLTGGLNPLFAGLAYWLRALLHM